MKKFFYLLTVCVSLSVAFGSCNDDDTKDDNVLIPANAVSNLVFTDTDPNLQKIGGTLSWKLPAPEANIDHYVIYLSDSNTSKDTKLGEVAKGTSTFTVPAGTAYKSYLLVVARNTAGESANITSVAVVDFQESEPQPELPKTVGVFILNRGNWNANNASLSYYNLLLNTMIPGVYKTVNGSDLGDSAEQMLIYGSKIYITVAFSSRLVVLDQTGKELESIPFYGDLNVPLSPRGLAAGNGKVYLSCYDGHAVASIDTATLTRDNMVSVGRYPERLAIAGSKLYVANSGGGDYPNYGHTVSVIDPESFTVEKEIDVEINPTRLLADSQGDVYLISMGDYGAVPNTLQRIDGATGEVSKLGNGSVFSLVNDKLYVIYAPYTPPGETANISFKKYDVLTETIESEGFITEVPEEGFTSISAISIDPISGKIYITDSGNYTTTGTLHIFSPDGKLETSMDTEGFDPNDIVFFIQ
jgi:hypothetical protein